MVATITTDSAIMVVVNTTSTCNGSRFCRRGSLRIGSTSTESSIAKWRPRAHAGHLAALANHLLRSYGPQIARIAETLLERQTLSGEEVGAMVPKLAKGRSLECPAASTANGAPQRL